MTITNTEDAHWILRVNDGKNFKNSARYKIWGIVSNHNKGFLDKIKQGDKLWFMRNKDKTDGKINKIIAVATYVSHNKRTRSNQELGWKGNIDANNNWDIEINYEDLYWLEDCELILEGIKGQKANRRYYGDATCKQNLPIEYKYIVRYSKAIKA